MRQAYLKTDTIPGQGQLWRARWEDTVVLVLIVAVGTTTVSVAPVTEDPDYADVEAVLLPAGECPLQMDMVVWFGLAGDLPVRVLDRTFGSVSETWCSAALGGNDTLAVRGFEIVLDTDLRRQYRAQLQDDLTQLSTAQWVPSGSGGLEKIFASKDLRPAALAAVLDLEVSTAVHLLRGQRYITRAEASVLAGHLQLRAEDLLAANPRPPASLCLVVDQPRHRPQLDRLASQRGTSDVQTHRDAAYGSWAMAARQTGPADDSVWEQRLTQYLTGVLHE